MRIGIDATPMFRRKGGIGWYTYFLVKYLLKIDRQNEYFLYTTTMGKEAEDYSILHNPNVRLIRTSKSVLRWWPGANQIDLYHGTNYKLPIIGRYRRVVTIHDIALDRFPHFSRKFVGQWWSSYRTRRTAQRANRVITVSHHAAREIQGFFGISPEHIAVIYNGVREEFYPDHYPERWKTLQKNYQIRPSGYILYVGGFEPRKNLHTLLRAYSSLPSISDFYQLVVVGEMGKWSKEIYQTIAILNLQGQVILTGYLPVEDLRVLYSMADLFVYPSIYEGFGLPPLEAMACGCPVITSNSSSLPEVVGDAALMVDPFDVEGLAFTIQRVLNDKELRDQLRKKGLDRASLFTWEKTARETLTVYRKACGDRS